MYISKCSNICPRHFALVGDMLPEMDKSFNCFFGRSLFLGAPVIQPKINRRLVSIQFLVKVDDKRVTLLHFWLFCIIHRELLTKGCYVKQFHKQRGDSTFLGHDTSNIQEKTRGRNLGWQDGVRLNHYRVMNRLYAAYQVVGRIMPIKSVCVCLVLMCCTKVNSLLKE